MAQIGLATIDGFMCDDGEMVRMPEMIFFARRQGLGVVSIAHLLPYDVPAPLEAVGE